MAIIGTLEKQEGFSELEKTVADYILEHRDDIGTMKATVLAEKTFTSKSTIIRLCKKLGCDGYESFRLRLISELEHTRDDGREIDFDFPFAVHEGVAGIIKSTTELYKETADICFEHLSREKLQRAAEWIYRARHLYLYGIGDSYISALSFANQLTKLGIMTVQPLQFQEENAITHAATAEDVALFASYSGDIVRQYYKEILLLRKKKCRTVLISSIKRCADADLLLHIPPKESIDGKISTFYSQAAFRIVFSCLYGTVYGMDYERHREQKKQQEIYGNL